MKMQDIIDVFSSTIEEKIGEEWKHEVYILGASYDHCNFEIDGKEYSDYPAISRRDNKTEICADCGLEEALNDWLKPRDEAKGGE